MNKWTWPQRRVALISTMLITLVGIFVLPLITHVIGTIKDTPTPILDLRGEWRVCFEKGDCIKQMVPHKSYPSGKREDFHYLFYTRSFPTTKNLLDVERSLIFTQIGEAATIELNGTKIKTAGSLPPNFRYSAHYPVVSTLSRDLLAPLGKMNEIKITAYTTKITEAGLRGELNGVFDRVAAVRYQEGKLLYDITFPIFAALLLLALAYYALRVALTMGKLRKIFWSYLWATLAAALFLINYSKLTNEFLPAWLTSHMHFLFRNLMDWTLLYFFLKFYERESSRRPRLQAEKLRKVISVLGHSIFGFLTILILVSLFIQTMLSDSSIQATLGATLPHTVSEHLSFLRILPLLVGVLGCLIDQREKLSGRILSAAGMSAIVGLQLHDIWSYSSGSTGIYFVKVFPIFVMYFYYTKINEIREEFIAIDAKTLSEAKTEVQVKRRVAHDLKHPIGELRALARELSDPDVRLKIKKSIADLAEMSQSLDGKIEFSTKHEPILLSELVEQVVEAASNRYKDFDITLSVDPSSVGVFSKLNPTEFSHVLLNVIANATESYDTEGEVRVTLRQHPSSKRLELRISDFGRGIDENLREKLFKEGATFGKAEGRGQGLFQARKILENWGGGVQLFSKAGEGTSVLLTLVEVAAPLYFANALDLSQASELVVISDKSPQLLLDRVAAFAPDLKITVLKSVSAAEEYTSKLTDQVKANLSFVVAAAMKRATSFSGVDFILKHGLEKIALVHFETGGDVSFEKAKENNIRILLSPLIHSIRIEAKRAAPGHELHILVDNDRHVRRRWEESAIKKGLRFQAFPSIRSLRSELHMIPVDTKIFVDADIDGNFDGVGLATELQDKGYTVTLATGYTRDSLPKSASKFKLIGKTPPWIRGVPV